MLLDAIKLYSDMGETDRALRLVEASVRVGQTQRVYLLGGDACRSAGRSQEAIEYYQKVLQDNHASNAEYLRRFHARAKESIATIETLGEFRY